MGNCSSVESNSLIEPKSISEAIAKDHSKPNLLEGQQDLKS
jgi:hypothetical protein